MQEFVDWCEQPFLQLNIATTKNMYINFRRHTGDMDSISMKGQTVQKATNIFFLLNILG